MNNIELEQKIKEILENNNFFDLIIEAKDFEKDYQKSDFFKETKMPLMEVIKNAKVFYELQFDGLLSKVQNFINSLNLDNIFKIIDEISSVFEKENVEITKVAEDLKKIMN